MIQRDYIRKNNDIKFLDYLLNSINVYPLLSVIAIEYLYVVTNSLYAETSFSKLRDLQDSKTNYLSSENLSMQMIIYFYVDIEDKLNY